jgi:aminoglycoside phosphotransferase (APT) family kinase protein
MPTMPHGYTNRVTSDGLVVTKSYRGPEARPRHAREARALAGLAGLLPVPPLLARQRDGRLDTRLMPGIPGQDLIDAGQARGVLRACGRMLRRIHATDPVAAGITAAGQPGQVLVHGDYGPNNTLLDPAARHVTAIVDWEWVHSGDPLEDLAWCEWIVRMHHPGHTSALEGFFAAYGRRPPWPGRHEAMLSRCRDMLGICQRWLPGGEAAHRWQQRIHITSSWTE